MQRRAFGNEIGFIHLPFQRGPVEPLFIYDTADIAHVQHAHDIVDVIAPDRKPRVGTGLDAKQNVFIAVIQVNAEHFAARHHDVVDGYMFQIKNIQQQLPVPGGYQLARVGYDSAQLTGGNMCFAFFVGIESEHAREAIGDTVHHCDQGIHDFQQRQQNQAGGKCNFLRVHCGDGFRCDLTENQNNHGEYASGDVYASIAPQADGNDCSDSRGKDIHQIVTDQDHTNQAIRTLQQFTRSYGPTVVLLLQVL